MLLLLSKLHEFPSYEWEWGCNQSIFGISIPFLICMSKINIDSNNLPSLTSRIQHSGKMFELLNALPFFSFLIALATSADVSETRTRSISYGLSIASFALSNLLLTLRTLMKCLLQCWHCSFVVLQSYPLPSMMVTKLKELDLFFQSEYLLRISTPSHQLFFLPKTNNPSYALFLLEDEGWVHQLISWTILVVCS